MHVVPPFTTSFYTQAWRCLLLALALASCRAAAAPAPASGVAVATNSRELYVALGDSQTTTIYLTQSLALNGTEWSPPLYIERNVTVQAHPALEAIASRVALDAASLVARVYIGAGAVLAFRSVELSRYALETGQAMLLVGPSPGGRVVFDRAVLRRQAGTQLGRILARRESLLLPARKWRSPACSSRPYDVPARMTLRRMDHCHLQDMHPTIFLSLPAGLSGQRNLADLQALPRLAGVPGNQVAFYLPTYCYNTTSDTQGRCQPDAVYCVSLAAGIAPARSSYYAPSQPLGSYDLVMADTVIAVDYLISADCLQTRLERDCAIALLRQLDTGPIIIKSRPADSNLVKVRRTGWPHGQSLEADRRTCARHPSRKALGSPRRIAERKRGQGTIKCLEGQSVFAVPFRSTTLIAGQVIAPPPRRHRPRRLWLPWPSWPWPWYCSCTSEDTTAPTRRSGRDG